MSFIKRLFGSPDAVSKITDAVVDTGDALFFTPEEKSKANQKQLDWVLKFHEASSGSNLARRLIAVMVVAVFLFLVMVNALLIVIDISAAGAMSKFIEMALLPAFGVVIAFYFTAAIITKIEQGVKSWKK